jgi:predicted MFS family arabinose efflux permease
MNFWRGLGALPASLWILAIASLVNRAGTMFLPFLTLYATQGLRFSPSEAGALLTIYGVCALVAAPISGRLADRWGAVRLMEGSLFLSGAVLFAVPLFEGFPALAAAIAVFAILGESFRPANLAAVAALAAPEQRRMAYALSRLAVNLGMSIGPAVGGFLAGVSFPLLCYVDGATSLLAALVLVLSRLREPPRAAPAGAHGSLGRGLRDRTLLFFLAATIPVAMVFFQHASAMPLYLVKDLNLAESTYGMLFTVNTLLIVVLEVPLTHAISSWTHRRSLALGALLFGLGFGSLALAGEVWGVVGTVVLWTFGEMILFPTASAYVAEIAPPDARGEYMGLYTMGFGVAFAVGPWAGTATYDAFGGTALWVATLALGALSAAMLSRVRR